MIAHLRGSLIEKRPGNIIVDVGGVGYDVTVPLSTFAQLPELGVECRLRIHTSVREDAIQLFGFASTEEMNLFKSLIGVTGIGPGLGIKILSGLAAPDLTAAISAGQTDRLTRIPGIGKKTAERLVLELRGKLGPAQAAAAPMSQNAEDVLSAITNQGGDPGKAKAAVNKAFAKAKTGSADDFITMFNASLAEMR